MKNRGYNPDPIWENVNWRGTRLGEKSGWANDDKVNNYLFAVRDDDYIIYPEHNDEYLNECLDNLKSKGIDLYDKIYFNP